MPEFQDKDTLFSRIQHIFAEGRRVIAKPVKSGLEGRPFNEHGFQAP